MSGSWSDAYSWAMSDIDKSQDINIKQGLSGTIIKVD